MNNHNGPQGALIMPGAPTPNCPTEEAYLEMAKVSYDAGGGDGFMVMVDALVGHRLIDAALRGQDQTAAEAIADAAYLLMSVGAPMPPAMLLDLTRFLVEKYPAGAGE